MAAYPLGMDDGFECGNMGIFDGGLMAGDVRDPWSTGVARLVKYGDVAIELCCWFGL